MIARDKKRLEEIKSLLFSNDSNRILTALERLDECPFPEMVQPLLVLFAQNTDETIKARLSEILGSLKMSGLEEIFFQALAAPELQHCRKDFIHFMWSSNIQPEEGWMHIAEVAATGSYEECIEVLSLLDNTDTELLEEELLEAVSVMKMAINDQPEHEAVAIRKLVLAAFAERLNS